LQPLAAEGSRGAEAALELKGDPSRLLATVQIGITIIAVLSGTFGQATFGERLQDYIAESGGFLAGYAHAVSMAVVVIGISYFSLILGELVPKRIALTHPERIAASVARMMHAMARVGAPLEWLLSATSDLILRILPLRGEPRSVTDEEIGFMLREGVAAGHIPLAETAIVEMALRLGERRVSAVMTPRTQIEFLDLDVREETRGRITTALRGSRCCRAARTSSPASSGQGSARGRARRASLQPARGAAPATVSAEHRDGAARAQVFKTVATVALVVDEYGDLQGW
jgi:putative hemolysin